MILSESVPGQKLDFVLSIWGFRVQHLRMQVVNLKGHHF
jgi:hypothetical protein